MGHQLIAIVPTPKDQLVAGELCKNEFPFPFLFGNDVAYELN